MAENLYTPNCIRTFTGQYFNLLNPDPLTIYPVDIAVGLARECRFGNHTKKFYSVAAHSIEAMNLGVEKYPDDFQLHFKLLMHDAHEAYCGDAQTPLGDLLGPLWKEMKKKIQSAINIRFRMSDPSLDPRVKEIDKILLEKEWGTKVLKWSGLSTSEESDVNVFINYFVKLCKSPYVLQP